MAKVFKTNVNVEADLATTGKLSVNASAGDEGGEIFLNKPVSNTAINTGVSIDIYQNKLRFWESGGTNRGYYVDITSGASSAGTSLTGGSTGAMNASFTNGTKQSAVSGAGTVLVSVSITTNGYPIQVLATGDMENNSAGGWVTMQLYRGTTAIGNIVHAESSSASENVPFALTALDVPAAGTYTYYLKLNNSAGGTFNFGESNGPVITVIELAGPKGDTGPAGATYTLPTASSTVLGGVKVGTNVSIDGAGAISVPKFDSITTWSLTAPTGFSTSSTSSVTTTGNSTALSGSMSFDFSAGYSLLNSNSPQTIAGDKTFSSTVTADVIGKVTLNSAGTANAGRVFVTQPTVMGTSATGTVGTVTGTGPYTATITVVSGSLTNVTANMIATATSGAGSLGANPAKVSTINSATSVTVTSATTMTAGAITALNFYAVPSATPASGDIWFW